MAKSLPDVLISRTWINLAARYPDIAGVAAYVQNKGPGELIIYFGDATVPDGKSGLSVARGDVITGTALGIWARSRNGDLLVQCGVADEVPGANDEPAPPAADRELVVSTYRVKTAFAGAEVGALITNTQLIDVTGGAPVTVSTIWRNQSAAADLAAAPAVANLELVGSDALTDAELTAQGLAKETTLERVEVELQGVNAGLGDAGATPPAIAGAGIIGWLRGIYEKLTGTIAVSGPVTDTQLRAAAVHVQAQWEDGPYTLDVSGNLKSETQINAKTGAVRTRAWTYQTLANGDVVATPGAWA